MRGLVFVLACLRMHCLLKEKAAVPKALGAQGWRGPCAVRELPLDLEIIVAGLSLHMPKGWGWRSRQ